MLDRINKILEEKQMSTTQFADFINIQRPTMSHIISGRNNPSLDIVMKILKSFPDINSDWLMFGEGKMYKNNESLKKIDYKNEPSEKSVSNEPKLNLEMVDLFSNNSLDEQKEIVEQPAQQSLVEEKYCDINNQFNNLDSQYDTIHPQSGVVNDEEIVPYQRTQSAESEESYINILKHSKMANKVEKEASIIEKQESKKILKIVFFYSDKSFSEFYPEN